MAFGPAVAEACPSAQFFGVRGSGEHSGFGTTVGSVLSEINKQQTSIGNQTIEYRAVDVQPWKPLYFPDYMASVKGGVQALNSAVVSFRAYCSATPLLIVGYSQGAEVVDRWVNSASGADLQHVVGVALLGDPRFSPRNGTTIDQGTYNRKLFGVSYTFFPHVSGFGGVEAYPASRASWTRSYCANHDPICNTSSAAALAACALKSCAHLHYPDLQYAGETFTKHAADFLVGRARAAMPKAVAPAAAGPSPAPAAPAGPTTAAPAPGIVVPSGTVDLQQGMAGGTSPAIAGLAGGGYEKAFQANTGSLIRFGTAGNEDERQGMAAGTSPAIAGLAGGGYEMAFQANTGSLIRFGTAGNEDERQGMAAGTSPAIAGLAGGGYEMAFQANTGELIRFGTAGNENEHQGMAAHTNPAIAGLTGGGYEMAFQANTGELIRFGTAGNENEHQGMAAGTSPAIAGLAGGGYEMAFQANTGELIVFGTAGNVNTHLGMMHGTSPSIAAAPNGGFQVSFQANTGSLYTYTG